MKSIPNRKSSPHPDVVSVAWNVYTYNRIMAKRAEALWSVQNAEIPHGGPRALLEALIRRCQPFRGKGKKYLFALSQAYMAHDTCLALKSIPKALKTLEDAGWITRTQRTPKRTSVIEIHVDKLEAAAKERYPLFEDKMAAIREYHLGPYACASYGDDEEDDDALDFAGDPERGTNLDATMDFLADPGDFEPTTDTAESESADAPLIDLRAYLDPNRPRY